MSSGHCHLCRVYGGTCIKWKHESIDGSHVEQLVGTWLHGNIASLPDSDIQFLTVHASRPDSHKLRTGGARLGDFLVPLST